MDEEYLMEAMSKMIMEFSREGKRRDAAQQAIESMVERVGCFDGGKVQNFLEAYNAEMDSRCVSEAMRPEYFCRVVAEPICKYERASKSSRFVGVLRRSFTRGI